MKYFRKFIFLSLAIISVAFCGVFNVEAKTLSPQWNVVSGIGGDKMGRAVVSNAAGTAIYITGSWFNGVNYDFRTMRYDGSGNLIWSSAIYDSGNNDYARGIAIDGAGNVYVTGYSWNGVNYDYRTIKYNASGVLVWGPVSYDSGGGGNKSDFAMAIAYEPGSNSVYVTGYTEDYSSSPTGYANYATLRYDASTGGAVWPTPILEGGSRAFGINAAANGTIYVTGTTYDYGGICNPTCGVYTVGYNSSGVKQWSSSYYDNLNSQEHGRAITSDSSGNIYVAVTAYNALPVVGDCCGWDFRLLKYTPPSTAPVFDVIHSSGYDDFAQAIGFDQTSNTVYVGGYYNNGGYAGGGTDNDFRLLKYSNTGSLIRDVLYHSGNDDQLYGLSVDNNGSVYVAGYSLGAVNDYRLMKYVYSTATCTGPIPINWIDNPIANVDKIRKTHFVQLRNMIDDRRENANLNRYNWTDPYIFGSASRLNPPFTGANKTRRLIRGVHLTELRVALNDVYISCGQAPPVYTDSVITPNVTSIRIPHLNELRAAVSSVR